METSIHPRTSRLPRRLRDTRLFQKLRKAHHAATRSYHHDAPTFLAAAKDTTTPLKPQEKAAEHLVRETAITPSPPPPYQPLPNRHEPTLCEVPRFRPAIHSAAPEIQSVAPLGTTILTTTTTEPKPSRHRRTPSTRTTLTINPPTILPLLLSPIREESPASARIQLPTPTATTSPSILRCRHRQRADLTTGLAKKVRFVDQRENAVLAVLLWMAVMVAMAIIAVAARLVWV